MLFTGAHHPREAVSIQMPLYILFKMLHGYLQDETFEKSVLENSTLYFIPMVNVDGVKYIDDHSPDSTKGKNLKRKNLNAQWGGKNVCGHDEYGVDLNRNYGFSHGNQQLKNDPCE